MTEILEKWKYTREWIIAELKRREWWKTISFEEAYKRGKDFINKLV